MRITFLIADFVVKASRYTLLAVLVVALLQWSSTHLEPSEGYSMAMAEIIYVNLPALRNGLIALLILQCIVAMVVLQLISMDEEL